MALICHEPPPEEVVGQGAELVPVCIHPALEKLQGLLVKPGPRPHIGEDEQEGQGRRPPGPAPKEPGPQKGRQEGQEDVGVQDEHPVQAQGLPVQGTEEPGAVGVDQVQPQMKPPGQEGQEEVPEELPPPEAPEEGYQQGGGKQGQHPMGKASVVAQKHIGAPEPGEVVHIRGHRGRCQEHQEVAPLGATEQPPQGPSCGRMGQGVHAPSRRIPRAFFRAAWASTASTRALLC